MVEQAEKFNKLGIASEFVGEAQRDPAARRKVLCGEVQIVLMSPENAIESHTYRSMCLSDIYQHRMVALVVDEAHCVKIW